MEEHEPSRDDDHDSTCPYCGGLGYYRIVPVGHVLCPECEGSGRAETNEAAPRG